MTEIVEAIDAISQTGQVNIFDRFSVIGYCRQMGYPAAAAWIAANPRDYARLILQERSSMLPVDQRSQL